MNASGFTNSGSSVLTSGMVSYANMSTYNARVLPGLDLLGWYQNRTPAGFAVPPPGGGGSAAAPVKVVPTYGNMGYRTASNCDASYCSQGVSYAQMPQLRQVSLGGYVSQ